MFYQANISKNMKNMRKPFRKVVKSQEKQMMLTFLFDLG